jgi:hypothetical protein
MRSGEEERFNGYTDNGKVDVDRWCKNIAEASFEKDGMYHGLATIKKR